MPQPAIPDHVKAQFFAFMQNGFTIKDASAEVGISYISGRRLHAALKNAPTPPGKRTKLIIPPHPVSIPELDPTARDCLDDFGRFRARYMGRKSSPWQEDAAYTVIDHLTTPFKEYGVVNCPPGSGKSTLFTCDIPAWLTARSRSIRGFIGSLAQTIANSYTGRLRTMLELTVPMQAKSEDLALGLALDAASTMAADYGVFRPDKGSGIPWSRSMLTVVQFGETYIDEKEATWTAFGRDTGFLGWRVNFIVWDDLVKTERLRTEEMIQADRLWWINEAETRLEPGGLLLLQGQRLGAEDLYRYNLDQKTGFTEAQEIFEMGPEQQPLDKKYFHIVYKAHHEEVCKVDTDPAVHSMRAPAYDPTDPQGGGCLLDPVRLPWRELVMIQNRPLSNYRVVYQQEDVDPSEVLVPQIWIDGGQDPESGEMYPGCWDEDRGIGVVPKTRGNRVSVVTIDPSPTKWWSIQWWLYVEPPGMTSEQLEMTEDVDGVYRLMGRRYLLDLINLPLDAPDILDFDMDSLKYKGILVDWAKRAAERGAPISHMIWEKNAAQRFVTQYDWFQRFFSSFDIAMIAHETTGNKSDEQYGVKTIKHHYRFGRKRLPGLPSAREVVQPLVTELTRYPDSSTDDNVMADWFFEFRLPHILPTGEDIGSLYNDIPGWMNTETSYA
jgi:hypothetical protein